MKACRQSDGCRVVGRIARPGRGFPAARRGCAHPVQACRRRHRLLGLACFGVSFLFCLSLPVGSTPKHRIRYLKSHGTTFLYMRDVADYYGMGFTPGTKRVYLGSQWSRLLFEIGRRESTINGVQVHLSDAPWISNGEPLLADHDFRLVLDPILRSKVLKKQSVRRILIDPGHGGRDPGASGRRYQEKEITLQVGRRLAAVLKAKGYAVALTRETDEGVSLAARARKARAWNADLLVSLHCNAVDAREVHGVEVFRGTPLGGKSTYSSRTATSSSANNAWDIDNARLAYELQKSIVAHTGARDRGIKNARFLVLRESSCPAALVEMGFLTNSTEERRLGSAAYQVKLVDGIVNGIIAYDRSLERR